MEFCLLYFSYLVKYLILHVSRRIGLERFPDGQDLRMKFNDCTTSMVTEEAGMGVKKNLLGLSAVGFITNLLSFIKRMVLRIVVKTTVNR